MSITRDIKDFALDIGYSKVGITLCRWFFRITSTKCDPAAKSMIFMSKTPGSFSRALSRKR